MSSLSRGRHSYFWSDEQIAFLRVQVSAMPLEDIAEEIGKSRKAVLNKCHSLKLPSRPRFFDNLEPELLSDGTALISLVGKKGKGKRVRVSQDRLPELLGRRIFLVAGYPSFNENGKHFYLHRFLRSDASVEVDHWDRNPLNATNENLRSATRQENAHNTGSHGGSSSYKGVDWRKGRERWRARVRTGNKTYFLGYFTSELEAARAYNETALRLHGEFARLNELEDE